VTAQLGIIEGFYGPRWPDAQRLALVRCLAAAGYTFYHYAPKADPILRARWRGPWAASEVERLAALADGCHRQGMAFGVGITPVNAELPLTPEDQNALATRLQAIDAVGADEIVLALDDVLPGQQHLAARQADLAHWVAARTGARRVCLCPTYYSDDPLLDRLFGARPAEYLAELGERLDTGIDVYWAGPAICPAAITPEHLEAVATQLRRWPLLWDNYPVNDGPDMAPYLHLRPAKGRPPELGTRVAGHAINPALQPTLTAIPALTLAESYQRGSEYESGAAFRRAAQRVLGEELADCVAADLSVLQDSGRQRMGRITARTLRTRYAAYDHPAAREIVAWLDGAYRAAAVPTQPPNRAP